ncbi:hypothetical protein OTK59_24060 [Vibrio natriegens]|uniref:hypothetical protein n=1 Tax=Vibrio natriegens TaxID=691 RepID=UPI0022837E2B|nr:hypothetical protein [Vibrio natriegens]MCY9879618.1 hypothetical protein [Vibrio natriegens]
MEDLQDKYTRILSQFEPEQRAKFLDIVEVALPDFNQNLDYVASELGVEILQEPVLLPFGTSLAKAKMRLICYLKSGKVEQPLKIDLALTSYLYKKEEQRTFYLKNLITKSINKVVTVKAKPAEKPLHVRFSEMIVTFKKGFAITQFHLETLVKVNLVLRSHRYKLFGMNSEPTIWDYSKLSSNELIKLIKDAE